MFPYFVYSQPAGQCVQMMQPFPPMLQSGAPMQQYASAQQYPSLQQYPLMQQYPVQQQYPSAQQFAPVQQLPFQPMVSYLPPAQTFGSTQANEDKLSPDSGKVQLEALKESTNSVRHDDKRLNPAKCFRKKFRNHGNFTGRSRQRKRPNRSEKKVRAEWNHLQSRMKRVETELVRYTSTHSKEQLEPKQSVDDAPPTQKETVHG